MTEGTSPSGEGTDADDSTADIPAAPRLIAGARVAGGRYRLHECHGGVPGQSFWKAHDERLDRDVALTFVDPLPGESAPGSAPATLERATQLTRVYSTGLARILDVVRGRAGGVVVSEWTPGHPLAGASHDTDGSGAHGLADAAARAEEAGLTLGVDSPDRVRVTPDGQAVLAFPAPGPGADTAADVRGLGAVLYCLLTRRWPLAADGSNRPDLPQPIGGRPPAAERDDDGTPVDPQSVSPGVPAAVAAVTMRALDGTAVSSAATVRTLLAGQRETHAPGTSRLSAHDPSAHTPSSHTLSAHDPGAGPTAASTPGRDGSSDASADRPGGSTWTADPAGGHAVDARVDDQKRWLIMAGMGVVSVVVIGALLAWLLGVTGGRDDSTPLAQQLDQIERDARASRSAGAPADDTAATPTTASRAPGPALAVATATSWQPVSSPGAAENSASAVNAVDGDPATSWATESYLDQFGPTAPAYKPGLGLLVTLEKEGTPRQAVVTTPDAGVKVEIRTATSAQPTGIQQTTLVGEATLTQGKNTIDLTTEGKTGHVLVWITKLHADGPKSYRAALTDVAFTG